jgi:hypothetical protein
MEQFTKTIVKLNNVASLVFTAVTFFISHSVITVFKLHHNKITLL